MTDHYQNFRIHSPDLFGYHQFCQIDPVWLNIKKPML